MIQFASRVFVIDISLQRVQNTLRDRVGLLHVELAHRAHVRDQAREEMLVDAVETVANAVVDEILAVYAQVSLVDRADVTSAARATTTTTHSATAATTPAAAIAAVHAASRRCGHRRRAAHERVRKVHLECERDESGVQRVERREQIGRVEEFVAVRCFD